MRIYMARPISGCSYDEVVNYYHTMKDLLEGVGYEVFNPMTGKSYLRNELEFKAHGYDNPVSTNHAIIERDRWMVQNSDIVLTDLSGAERVSIGCMMEVAWAHQLGKHTLIVMEEDNIHRHAFVLEAGDIIFSTLEEATKYLVDLSNGRA